MSLRRLPSLGSLALLALLVVVLVSGGDESSPGGGGRGGGDRGDVPAEHGGAAGGRGQGEERGKPDSGPGGDSGSGGGGSAEPGVVVPVVDVVDGDTIEVSIHGEVEDVRYIGVDTPETVAPGEPVGCYGPEASRANHKLVEGARVRLVFDAERRDVYGRLLAYVYLEPGEEFVNAELVRRGLARTLTIPPNDRHAERFDRLEQEAANAGRGLWGAC